MSDTEAPGIYFGSLLQDRLIENILRREFISSLIYNFLQWCSAVAMGDRRKEVEGIFRNVPVTLVEEYRLKELIN
jgi:hypothetical protein